MRISRWLVEEIVTKKQGLEPIYLDRLGTVVALIGKNGSGKSRVLKILEDSESWLQSYMFEDSSIEILRSEIPSELNYDFASRYDLKLYINYLTDFSTTIRNQKIRDQINKYIGEIKKIQNRKYTFSERLFESKKIKLENKGKRILEINDWGRSNYKKDFLIGKIKKIKYSDVHLLKDAISNNIEKDDKNNSRPEYRFQKLLEITPVDGDKSINEMEILNQQGLTFFETLKHELVRDFHINQGIPDKFNKEPSFKQYNSLRNFIKEFMAKELTWDKSKAHDAANINGVITTSIGIWKLNGLDFNYNSLSDGEKTLFAYSLLFFILEMNSNVPMRNSIIVIDEPELHLHPSSEIAVINGIKNVIKDNGQLWIATHSLSILSSLEPNEIFLVKDGMISSPNRLIPGKALTELMDADVTIERVQNLEKLRHFVTSQSNWAYINFIEQCFEDPEVFFTAERGDPQVEIFINAIKDHPTGATLLDFGAGKGRLFKEIRDDTLLGLEYYALERDAESRETLKALGVANEFIIDDYTKLEKAKFDFICMCNVLHEIKIDEWEDSLKKIIASLKQNGQLIIIEDLMMPTGEWIDGAGFLVLDIDSLIKLFSLTRPPLQIKPEKGDMSERILCAVISKKSVGEINKQTIIKALAKRKETVWNRMIIIKPLSNQESNSEVSPKKDVGIKDGREYGFLSQLFINCERGIAILNP